MKQEYNNTENLNKSQKVLLAVSTVILSIIILFSTYYFIINKSDSSYINTLYKQKLVIDSANKEAAEAVKYIDQIEINDTDKLNKIISTLSKSESALQKAIDDLNQTSPPKNYKAQFESLKQGIILNKKIYTQTLLILKNTKSNNLKNAAGDLEEYISQTYQYYENSKLGKVYLTLPSDILVLSDKLSQFAFKAYSDYEAKTRLLDQYNAYFNSMDKILTDFQNIKTNLNEQLQLIRDGKANLEDAYIKIENKLSSLDTITKYYNGLAVPVKAANHHQKFSSFITMYSNYCLDYKTSLYKLEEAGSNEVKLMEVNMQFENLNTQYNSINNSFIDYLNKYNEIKSYYTDPNNL